MELARQELQRLEPGAQTRTAAPQPPAQADLFAPADPLRAALAAADPDQLSPRAALDLLYRLQALARAD
jgi:DNA mismatch repair protein MutS